MNTKCSLRGVKRFAAIAALMSMLAVLGAAQARTRINLDVDATRAAQNVIHVNETLNATPGDFTLIYPKWIPGEHSPTGPINDVVDFYVTAGGTPLKWRRDDVEMFAIHVTVPVGTRSINVAFDDVSQPGTVATASLARIKWNRLLFYPKGARSSDVQVAASMRIPAGWNYATALTTKSESGGTVNFADEKLDAFVDSPAVIGRYFVKVPLSNDAAPAEIDIAGESADSIKYNNDTLAGWKNLVRQANLAFGAHHYRKYKFLLTVSDAGGSEGLEHHESSEDGVGEKGLSDAYELIDLADLLGHEYAHSWNGKYRRPASLTTPDFEQPMKGDLLWVYEGLTQYLGHVLPARSGLWTPEIFRESIADTAAGMQNQEGRNWRPLVDTARSVQILYPSPRAWRNNRRTVDYYDEGSLIWLDADVLIRQRTNGRMSLDNFLQKFHGRQSSGPAVVPYDLNEIAATLNTIAPYDWRKFFEDRVYTVQPRAPLDGITNGGWDLVYNSTPNVISQGGEERGHYRNLTYSIGIVVTDEGEIRDVRLDSPAGRAGMSPGMKIMKVNGKNFSASSINKAMAATADNDNKLEFTTAGGTYNIAYTGGERYPHLVRRQSAADFLSEIAKPR